MNAATQNTNIFGAGGLGGAFSIILVWFLEAYILKGEAMPDEVSAALATVLIIGFGILIPRSPEPVFSVQGSQAPSEPELPRDPSPEARERARQRRLRRKRRESEAAQYQQGIADVRAYRERSSRQP